MSDLNIQSIRIGSKKNHFEFTSEKKVDKVKMKFKVDSPNEIWVSDTTYFKFKNIFYYICVIIDLYSRKVIAFAISKKHSTQLITSTFRLAHASRFPQGKLTFHSNRGTQYTSFAFRDLLKYYSVTQSFSPASRPKCNAGAEAFFSTLKREELYRCVYHSEIEFRNRVKDYMDFYNSERPHITLNYKSPNTYEKQFYATQEKSRKQNGQFKST